MVVLLVVRHYEIPSVHTVSASVGDGITGLEIGFWMGEQMAGSPTVDTDDVYGGLHGSEPSPVRC